MNTEQKRLQNIKDYFQTELPSGIIIIEKDAKLIIDVPVINIRTGGMAFGLIVMIIITAKVDLSFYFIPLIAGYLFILGCLWAEFGLLNNVVLDLENKTLHVHSSNFLKRLMSRLLKWNNTFQFNEIAKFSLSHNWELNILDRYYLIEMIPRNGRKIKLFYTQKNDTAVKLIDFLKTAIKLK